VILELPRETPEWVRSLLGTPLQIAVIVVVAMVTRWILLRIIGRIAEGIANGSGGLGRPPAGSSGPGRRPRCSRARPRP